MGKNSYKEELPHGQGKNLDPKDYWELKSDKRNPFKEKDESRRLDKTNLDHYYSDDHGLGSPSSSDDFGEDSFP